MGGTESDAGKEERPIFGKLTMSLGLLGLAMCGSIPFWFLFPEGIAYVVMAWVIVCSWLYAVVGPRGITEYKPERIELPAQIRYGMAVFFVACGALASFLLPQRPAEVVGRGLVNAVVAGYLLLLALSDEGARCTADLRHSRWWPRNPYWWRPVWLGAAVAIVTGWFALFGWPELFLFERAELLWSVGLVTALAYVHIFQLTLAWELRVPEEPRPEELKGRFTRAHRWSVRALGWVLWMGVVSLALSDSAPTRAAIVLVMLALGEAAIVLRLARAREYRELAAIVWPVVGCAVGVFFLADLLGFVNVLPYGVPIAGVLLLYSGMGHFFLREVTRQLAKASAAQSSGF